MKNKIIIARVLFAVPWIIFGIQHFLYAGFVATLVPGFIPFKLFFALFTGAAMIAAGVSFIVNRAVSLAAMLLGLMLSLFILLIHIPALATTPFAVGGLTRPLQDVALASACFLLMNIYSRRQTKNSPLQSVAVVSRYIFALMLVGFGVQQFFNLDFLTAKIPPFFPFRVFWVYLMGLAFIGAGALILAGKKVRFTATTLGTILLVVNLLNHGYLLANNLHEPLLWTAAMLDLAIMGGVFILANSFSPERETALRQR